MKNRPISHIVLIFILITIIVVGVISTVKISNSIKEMATTVSNNMKNTMDPKAPDPGKTQSETIGIPEN
jgi:archaellum component FlaG (FlaF/FlaG flagellin family)